MRNYFTFIERKKASTDAYTFYFKREQSFIYQPGQYLRVTVDNDCEDDRGNSRYFTISSSPTEKNIICITSRMLDSCFKRVIFHLKKGDKVMYEGPYGNFVLDINKKKPIVFLAGGIGITPFRSMVRYLNDQNLNIPITLFSSFSNESDVLFYNELKSAENNLSNFKYILILTKDSNSDTFKAEKGRIDEEKIKEHVANYSESLYYVVGPTLMVAAMLDVLKKIGIERHNIRTESFPGY